jgi:arsenate reductase (glutaredoxin)
MSKSGIVVWGITTCGTVKKATRYLKDRGVNFEFMDLKQTKPPKALLESAVKSVNNPRKMFNTSGASYKTGGFKDKAPTMNEKEIVAALLADPMLIKRPIVHGPNGVTVGFDEGELEKVL